MRWVAAIALVLLAAPAAVAGSEGLEIVAVDASGYPEVVVTVEVPQTVEAEELEASDFVLIENGYAISAGVWAFESQPLQVVLVIDTSGSMAGASIEDAKEAARQFLGRLPDGARVALVSSGAEARVVHALGGDIPGALESVDALSATGETALYDAVVAGAELFGAEEGRRVMLILSDGGDTVSAASLGDAVDALGSAGSEAYVVALQTDETDTAALSAVAAVSDGRVVPVDEASGISEAFGSVADDLRRRFRLAYLSRESGTVEIVVALAGGDGSMQASATVELPEPLVPPSTPTTAAGAGVAQPTVPAGPDRSVGGEPALMAMRWTFPAGVAAAVAGAAGLLVLLTLGRRRRPDRPVVGSGGGRARGMISSLAHRAEGVTERVMENRRGSRLERDLDRAGVPLKPAEFVVLSASLGVAVIAGGLIAFGGPFVIVAAALAIVGPRVALRVMTARRRSAFADQFEGTLQMISGGLRAGYGLMQSVATVAEEAPSPSSEEFSRVVVENQLGRGVEDSLRAMSERMDNEDLRWVTEAIDIQYEVGGDLAEVLDTVAATIRDRDQIRRQVKALSAEGRMSAVILISMPFGLALLISLVSPDYLAELTGTGIGKAMIVAALVMIGIGAAWIRRIVKVVF